MTITGIELWDFVVAGKLLQEWRHDASFPLRVADVVVAACPDVDAVHLAGGDASEAIEAAIAARGLSCTRSTDPFAPARAGAAMAGACADIGQTSIKLVAGDSCRRIARDLERAPLRDDVPRDRRDDARRSTIAAIAEVLRGLGTALVGLPCEIVDGIPRSCTYCWRDPDPDLVPELERASGTTIRIINDAVLAAHAAPRRRGTTLVLTIGFGVGAAVVTDENDAHD